MNETETLNDWTRVMILLEKQREAGEPMSDVRLVDSEGAGEVLPQKLIRVLLQAAREMELGREPVVAHGGLLLDLVQAADQSSTRPEVMNHAVEIGHFPNVRMADGRQMVPLFAVSDLLTHALADETLALVRELRESEEEDRSDDPGDVPF